MESRKIGDGFFRPTITPHLIPLISAFIKSSKERGRRKRVETREREREWTREREFNKSETSGQPVSLPSPPLPLPTNICPRNNYTSTPPHHLTWGGFARASHRMEGRIRACWNTIRRILDRCSLQNPSLCFPL